MIDHKVSWKIEREMDLFILLFINIQSNYFKPFKVNVIFQDMGYFLITFLFKF